VLTAKRTRYHTPLYTCLSFINIKLIPSLFRWTIWIICICICIIICIDEPNNQFYHIWLIQLTDWLTDWLTPWSRVLETLAVTQLINKFPAFYGNRRSITVFTTARHWSLFWAIWVQSTPSRPMSLRSILILTLHLRLCPQSDFFPSDFPTKISDAFLISIHATPRPSHLTVKIQMTVSPEIWEATHFKE
jgi:hypothetical protein